MSTCELRATLYHALAEALSEPPEWLAQSGEHWLLREAARQLASISAASQRAAKALAGIDKETLEERRKRYAALINGIDPTCLCLYESGWLSRRLLNDETLAVEACYREMGLDMVGAEMPDHVSLELAFLGYLAENEANCQPAAGSSAEHALLTEREFVRRHASRWLPALGKAIAASGDPVYGPVGRLLTEWLEEASRRPAPAEKQPARVDRTGKAARRMPEMVSVEACTLCGFCVQDCRAGALVIRETEQITRLLLLPTRCTGCSRCTRSCGTGAIHMGESLAATAEANSWLPLIESPRGACRQCGAPLVSQAELSYLATRLNAPSWLDLCQECRS